MDKKFDMIQLPPLPKDTDAETLKLLWEYAKMPEEGQKRMKEYFDMALKLDNHPIDKTKEIYEIPSDGLKSFQAVMKDMIGNLIVELSQFACWVYHQIYVQGKSAGSLLSEHPESGDLIRIMSDVFAEMMKDDEEETAQQ